MAEWAPKRFWTCATVEPAGDGFAVHLDGRPVRTPAKTPLILPKPALAQAIAVEWDAQQGLIRPETMPMTRMANSALDKVAPLHGAVVVEVAGFGGSDLLCYRAEAPAPLVARQVRAWDPLLDWIAVEGAPLVVTAGLMPVVQPEGSLARLRDRVAGHDPFRLTALHDLVAITGSLVLGLAIAAGRIAPEEAWDLSRIDEDWQAEEWGADEEAAEAAALRRAALLDASRFFGLCG